MTRIREQGFTSRASVAEALRWIEVHVPVLGSETIPLYQALGRVLSRPLRCGEPQADVDHAAVDGFALDAAATLGASDYNVLEVACYSRVELGAAIPSGADAVLSFAAATERKGRLDVAEPAAAGAGIERRSGEVPVIPAGPLRPAALAVLAEAGATEAAVVRRPRVGLMVAGARSGADALTAALRALVGSDGGLVPDDAADLDLVIAAGRSGCGWSDDMPERIAAAGGMLHLHGLALRPGESGGVGMLGRVPLVLLPGSPPAALMAYEMLAGAAVRRLGGLPAALPHPTRWAVLDRKAGSAIGMTDLVQVRLAGDRATPLGPADTGGLARMLLADGFIIVPDGLEGFAPGTRVQVHLHGRGAGA